jgi:hypothetical protein
MSNENPTHNYTGYGWEGENYESGLDIKEIAKRLRKHLKDNHREYKFSVTIERYSGGQSLNIYLMEAPYKVVKGAYTHEWVDGTQEIVYKEIDEQYAQLNHHCLNDYADSDIKNNGYVLDERVIPVLKDAVSFAQGYNYDDSNSQIDYFNTNFYMHLSVGKWNRPCANSHSSRIQSQVPESNISDNSTVRDDGYTIVDWLGQAESRCDRVKVEDYSI